MLLSGTARPLVPWSLPDARTRANLPPRGAPAVTARLGSAACVAVPDPSGDLAGNRETRLADKASLTYIERVMLIEDQNPPLPHDAIRVLFAAESSSIPVVREMLSALPICARGQVFVEVDSVDDIVPIASPGRVTVTWLARDRRSGAPGTGAACAPGEAVSRAVRAWLAEMYVDAGSIATGEHLIWLGGPTSFAYDLRHDLHELFRVDAATAV